MVALPKDQIALSDALREFYARGTRVLDQIMVAHGASLAQTKLLSFIASNAPVRSADIARSFGFAPRTVTEALDNLERERLIRREPDATDRRAKRIVLTEAGLATIAASEPLRVDLMSRMFSVLSDDEMVHLTTLVEKLNKRIEEIRDEARDDANGPAPQR